MVAAHGGDAPAHGGDGEVLLHEAAFEGGHLLAVDVAEALHALAVEEGEVVLQIASVGLGRARRCPRARCADGTSTRPGRSLNSNTGLLLSGDLPTFRCVSDRDGAGLGAGCAGLIVAARRPSWRTSSNLVHRWHVRGRAPHHPHELGISSGHCAQYLNTNTRYGKYSHFPSVTLPYLEDDKWGENRAKVGENVAKWGIVG